MKKMILAVAMLSSAVFASSSHASGLAFPIFGCVLKGNVTSASDVELLIIRGEEFNGIGYVECRDAVNQKWEQHVSLRMNSVGVGPAFNLPTTGVRLAAARVGLVTVDGMAGEYQLQGGPRLGIFSNRVGVLGGVQVSGQGAGLGVDFMIEDKFSVGVDLAVVTLVVKPIDVLHKVKKGKIFRQ